MAIQFKDPDALTLEYFANLRAAWPDSLAFGGVLLARISSKNNRPAGDEDVLVRALVLVPGMTLRAVGPGERPHYEDPFLARLTIRTPMLSFPNSGPEYIKAK